MSILSKSTRIAAAVGIVASTTSLPAVAALAASNSAGSQWATSQNLSVAVGPANATLLSSSTGCTLAAGVQHVFYIGFDNFHLRRDNANTVANNGDDNRNADLNIPSDLEQVPALYNFLRGSSNAGSSTDAANYADGRNTGYTDSTSFSGGTILANHHTPLISHTSVDFTSAYSGVYGDRNGVATAQNSLAAYNGNAYTGGTTAAAQAVTSVSNGGFGFWTDPLTVGTDTTPQFLTKTSSNTVVNAPAPWVPFTRAGCDVGAVSATTMVLENQNSVNDVNAVTAGAPFTTADEGVSVHCAPGSPVCGLAATDANVKEAPDNLPAEPGAPYNGASGYYALYGHRFVAPAINDRINSATSGGSTTLGLLRSPSSTGFPGFNGEDANYTLGYTLAMQKAGIPVTFGYLTTPHNCYTSLNGSNTTGWSAAYDDYNGGTVPASNPCNHTDVASTTDSGTSSSFGSGEQGYVNYLHQLNTDFQTFFDQAKAAGYTTANTEFVFYSDENDHMAEGTPANATCDGVTAACQYNHAAAQLTPTAGQMGEVTVKLDSQLPRGGTTSFVMLNDSAPDFYVENQGTSGPPSQSDPTVRTFERSLGSTTYTDPYDGTVKNVTRYEADQTGMNALHMITADPNRSPTVDAFSAGENFVESGFPTDCVAATNVSCSNAGFIGVHGDFAPETTTTWTGFVGPGVANHGVDTTDWTDHVDMRPTLLALVGLQDDYTDEGRVVTQILTSGVVNPALTTTTAGQLGSILKQIDAPNYGATETSNTGFGPAVLVSDTEAIQSNAPGDSTFSDVTARIATITSQRNLVVSDIQALLSGAAAGTAIDSARASTDIANGQCLLTYANQLKTYALTPTAANAPVDCMGVGTIVPETSHAALLVLSGGAVLAGALLFVGRRRRVRIA